MNKIRCAKWTIYPVWAAVIKLCFQCFIDVTYTTFRKHNCFKADYVSMNQALDNVNLNVVLGDLTVDESWECPAEKKNVENIGIYVPVSKAINGHLEINPMTRECIRIIKKKRRKWLMAEVQILKDHSTFP